MKAAEAISYTIVIYLAFHALLNLRRLPIIRTREESTLVSALRLSSTQTVLKSLKVNSTDEGPG